MSLVLADILPIVQIVGTFILLIPFVSSAAIIISGNLSSSNGKSSENYRQVSLEKLHEGFVIVIIVLLLLLLIYAIAILAAVFIDIYNSLVT